MSTEETVKVLNALYPQELLEKYKVGERDFARINLLRKELEYILGATASTDAIELPYSSLDKFNPLWADCHSPLDRRFEWDSYGRFIPIEYEDILPRRDLRGVKLSGINLEGSYLYPVDFSHANLEQIPCGFKGRDSHNERTTLACVVV